MKKKSPEPRILYPVKLFFKSEGDIGLSQTKTGNSSPEDLLCKKKRKEKDKKKSYRQKANDTVRNLIYIKKGRMSEKEYIKINKIFKFSYS